MICLQECQKPRRRFQRSAGTGGEFDATGFPAEAAVQTRVKMGQTSDVYALVKVGGQFLMTKKEIKVTLGGCGG